LLFLIGYQIKTLKQFANVTGFTPHSFGSYLTNAITPVAGLSLLIIKLAVTV
jgi:hypothetical protein